MENLLVALRVILSLAAVVGLLWVVQRRITKGPKAQRAAALVTVVARQGIAQKASVVVLDVDGQRYLLGVTEHSVTVLNTTELPPKPVEALVPIVDTAMVNTAIIDAGAVFGSALTSAKVARAPLTRDQFDPKTGLPRGGAFDGSQLDGSILAGSILSPATWKRAVATLRRGR